MSEFIAPVVTRLCHFDEFRPAPRCGGEPLDGAGKHCFGPRGRDLSLARRSQGSLPQHGSGLSHRAE
jgi:hypothetical protein